MEKYNSQVSSARRRIETLTFMLRWIWLANAATAVVAAAHGHYSVATLAGCGWAFSLFAAAIGRRTIRCLGAVEDTIKVIQIEGFETHRHAA